MNIVIVTDDYYAQYAAVMLTSMYEHTKHSNELRLYVLYHKLSENSKAQLTRLVKRYQSEIVFIEAKEDLSKYHEGSYVSRTAYLKIYIPNYLPSSEQRALYLDGDIIVQFDIFQFNNIDLDHYHVAAVQDCNEAYAQDLGISVDTYFNSGVLMINLQKWREDNISLRAFEYVLSPENKRNTCDQDALNSVLWDKWLRLDRNFNYLLVNHDHIESPYIIHYAAKDKPWHLLYSGKYKDIYEKYEKTCNWEHVEQEDFSVLRSHHIVIYGASSAGQAALELLQQRGLDIVSFIDADDRKQGSLVMGKLVYSSDLLQQLDDSYAIIVPSLSYYGEIMEFIMRFGFIPLKSCNKIFIKR